MKLSDVAKSDFFAETDGLLNIDGVEYPVIWTAFDIEMLMRDGIRAFDIPKIARRKLASALYLCNSRVIGRPLLNNPVTASDELGKLYHISRYLGLAPVDVRITDKMPINRKSIWPYFRSSYTGYQWSGDVSCAKYHFWCAGRHWGDETYMGSGARPHMKHPDRRNAYLEYITLEGGSGSHLLWASQSPFLIGGSPRFSPILNEMIEHIIGGTK